ncbi:glycosyltransferase [Desulfovibrio sp. JC022]|uniref:glycosyltransferase n=1 Tax=Desulfovibrio sp. JC022 TaxID=2593642 RepID=UPI0013D1B64B|nr:glycosyltransferase [Desulfovibrio sp. JC022]NDV21325.1 glycosyltransferase [Desulfovibrio sp. JC022]
MDTFWNRLPRELAEKFIVGGVGRTHLTGIGYKCIELSKNDPANRDLYIKLAFETLLSAWCHDPLNLQSAELQQNLMGQAGPSSPMGKMLARIIEESRKDDFSAQEKRLHSLISRERFEPAAELLTQLLGEAPDSLNLLKLSKELYEATDEEPFLKAALQLMENIDFSAMEPLHDFLSANLHFGQGEYEQAAAYYEKSYNSGSFPEALPRLGECMLRRGYRDEAIRLYRQDAEARPWRINTLLRTFDLISETDLQNSFPPGKVAILIYSYNKADELDATLEAVFETKYENAFLAVLDNGSSDGTSSVIDKWEAVAKGRADLPMVRFDLHVNIGAPAARNWLLFHPKIAEADFAAFLDDDALPPQDWLLKLGAAIKRYPHAGVWGCKVVDAPNPRKLQSIDLHIKNESSQDGPRLRTTDIQLQTMDYGQFDYMRPCGSVTGCCHIMRIADLEKTGGFDIRFSPSQFDDLDRDLRLCLQKKAPVYQGHLRVRHLKRTGSVGATSKKAAAIQIGNLARLDMKYSALEARDINSADFEATLSDVLEKIKILSN